MNLSAHDASPWSYSYLVAVMPCAEPDLGERAHGMRASHWLQVCKLGILGAEYDPCSMQSRVLFWIPDGLA